MLMSGHTFVSKFLKEMQIHISFCEFCSLKMLIFSYLFLPISVMKYINTSIYYDMELWYWTGFGTIKLYNARINVASMKLRNVSY